MSESACKPKVRPRSGCPQLARPEPLPDTPIIHPEWDLLAEWQEHEQNEKQDVLFDENHVPG